MGDCGAYLYHFHILSNVMFYYCSARRDYCDPVLHKNTGVHVSDCLAPFNMSAGTAEGKRLLLSPAVCRESHIHWRIKNCSAHCSQMCPVPHSPSSFLRNVWIS